MSDQLLTRFAPTLITNDGRFSGYGAVFGNRDSHGDVIERGAFAASLKEWSAKGKLPPMRLQHGSAGNMFRHDDLPVGKWMAIREDACGLRVEGQLLALDTDQGKRLLSLIKANVLDGLSIGFRAKRTRAGTGSIKRYLVEVDLAEISLVDEPSNDAARVAPLTPADVAFDKLRDALHLANTKSTAVSTSEEALEKLKAALQRAV